MEIKTVRIVKRESQLRQKDKSRRGPDETELTSVGEAENQECDGESPEDIIERDAVLSQFRRALSLPRGYDRRSRTGQDAISRIPNFRHHMLKRMVDRVSQGMTLWFCAAVGSLKPSVVYDGLCVLHACVGGIMSISCVLLFVSISCVLLFV